MKFGIVLPTYYRKDGKSIVYLYKAIQNIMLQKHSDWKLFLVGDDYEKPDELDFIKSLVPKDMIRYINLGESVERSKYSGNDLWLCSGTNALNRGIEMLEEEGIEYYAHFDHEDRWTDDHLLLHNKIYEKYPSVSFVYSKAHFIRLNNLFPPNLVDDRINNLPPRGRFVIHHSVTFNINKIKHRYINMIDEGVKMASDVNLWNRINKDVALGNVDTYHIPKATAYHLEEGYCANIDWKL
jgi:hypothetical protein